MTRHIDAYCIADFLVEIQKAFQEGYVLDLDSNENYPQSIGTRYFVGLVQQDGQPVKVVAEDEILGDTEAPKRGRKPKA